MVPEEIVRLADMMGAATKTPASVLIRRACGSGNMYARLRNGHDITTRRAARIAQWLSDHWPPSADWPSDIPRPAPSADAPAALLRTDAGASLKRPSLLAKRQRIRPDTAGASAEGADPVAAVEALQREIVEFWVADPVDHQAIEDREGRKFSIALRLDEAGTLASPHALCTAFGYPLDVYRTTVSQYAEGGRRPGGRPRSGSRYAKMLAALRLAGDVRFSGRRAT